MKQIMLFAAVCGVSAALAAERKLYIEDYRDKMAGAWIGQSVGVAYGEPTEFKRSGEILPESMMPVWKPEMINSTYHQDDVYVEMTFLRTLETRGIGVSCRDAGIDFANSRFRLWCANANARKLLRQGIAAPSSSHPKNHPSPDDIDYQIEADFSGIISPGMPARAVKLGEQFGRIMNYGDGVYAGQFIGGMYAAAYFENDCVKTVEAGLKCIPVESKYAAMVRDMLAWYKADQKNWKTAWTNAVEKYGRDKGAYMGKVSFPGIDVKINGAMVLLGYLWGEGDIDKTMYISTAGGYDSDCNPSSAVGVLGVQIGAKGFGEKYAGKLDKTRKWEFTEYDYAGLLAVCEKLTRAFVAADGGKFASDEKGEYFIIPEKTPVLAAAVDSLKPGPGGDDKYTAEEMNKILFFPCKKHGERSVPAYFGGELVVKDGDSIAFLGDSITQAGNGPAGYVNLVMKGLEVAGVRNAKKIAAGISGHKSNNMLERVDRDCLAKKPTFMTVSCGVNDVWHGPNGVPLDDYKKNMSAIFDKAAASNVTVIVLTPTMIGEDRDNANNRKLGGYISWLLDEAIRRKLPFADLYRDMCDEIPRIKNQIVKSGGKPTGNLLTSDGVHMAFGGDCMMAWGILKAMGVPESKKDEIYAAWRKIPGAHSVKVQLSEEERDALKKKAGGKSLTEFIRETVIE